jgi:hypothetical protein
MENREELRRELIKALKKRVACEERVKEFLKPMMDAWNEGKMPTVTIDSAAEYDRINKEFEEAFKEYNALFRKYVEGNR